MFGSIFLMLLERKQSIISLSFCQHDSLNWNLLIFVESFEKRLNAGPTRGTAQ